MVDVAQVARDDADGAVDRALENLTDVVRGKELCRMRLWCDTWDDRVKPSCARREGTKKAPRCCGALLLYWDDCASDAS